VESWVRNDKRVAELVRGCFSDVEVVDPQGNLGRGFTNLKRIFGSPDAVRVAVDALAGTVRDAGAVASADWGSAPLAALVGYRLALPTIFVRSEPKPYFLSYGGDPSQNHPRLAGERLSAGTPVHVIEDFVHSGATLASAVEALREAGLVVQSASSLLASPPVELATALAQIGVQLTSLVQTDAI
jgi:orotate phosphoribosyltransferase